MHIPHTHIHPSLNGVQYTEEKNTCSVCVCVYIYIYIYIYIYTDYSQNYKQIILEGT